MKSGRRQRSGESMRWGALLWAAVSVTASMAVWAAGGNAPPTLPETPAGRLMAALIASINSPSAGDIDRFVATDFVAGSAVNDSWPSRCCDPKDVTATLANIARRSGGVTLEEVQANGVDVVAFVKARNSGTRIYLQLRATDGEPAKIRSYQIVPMLHSTGEVLPPTSAQATFGERLEMARRAVGEAAGRDLFSGTLLVASQGKVLLEGAYGEADKATHRKISLETRFGLASVGKLFTGVAVAQLVSKGLVDYDTPIARYVPDYPNREVASRITLRQLLTHTSGLADIYAESKPKTPLRRLADYYPLFANRPLLFEPGKGQSYSNTGFLVASMVVERVSGEEFRHYLEAHIFKPAGMTHTSWIKAADVAVPYTLDDPDDPLAPDRPWVSAEPFYADLLGGPAVGAGGEYSTVGDLLAFATALGSGRILDSRAFSRLIEEGLGCLCSHQGGHRVYGHGGGGPGVDTGIQFDVGRKFVVIFLSNYSPPFPQQLAGEIGQLLEGPEGGGAGPGS